MDRSPPKSRTRNQGLKTMPILMSGTLLPSRLIRQVTPDPALEPSAVCGTLDNVQYSNGNTPRPSTVAQFNIQNTSWMWSGAVLASLLTSLSCPHTGPVRRPLASSPALDCAFVVCDLANETVLSGASDSERVWRSLRLYHLPAARDLGRLRQAQLLVQLVMSSHWNRLYL